MSTEAVIRVAPLPEASDNIRLRWTLAALLCTLAPHVAHLPLWVTAFALVLGGWRYSGMRRGWNLPPAVLRHLLAFGALIGVWASYRTLNGVEAGSALLALMAALKLTETRTRRDEIVLVFMAYFLIAANLLYEQSLWAGAWAVPSLWLAATTHLQVGRSGSPLAPATALRATGGLLAQTLPLALVMFLLFPRVPGPFWSVPKRGESASTGLSEEMQPGSLSRLIESDAIAFRVRFEGRVPARAQLYWRGPVFHAFDGRRWTPGTSGLGLMSAQRVTRSGAPVTYDVTLEPSHQRWLFALDIASPDAVRPLGTLRFDYQPLSYRPIDELMQYSMTSWPDAVGDDLPAQVRQLSLELPEGAAERARTLARQWRDEAHAAGGGDAEIAQRALMYFREQPFYYTLSPPPLGADPVDDFLFGTRRGFCEHFSSAFTVLMRAAGIPARVVTGYLGGELNPLSAHMTVRQSDAHAWSEVWLGDRGWVRVDPTGYVAPERIEYGIDRALAANERVPGRLMRTSALLGRLRDAWDAATFNWNDWVLGYDRQRQYALLEWFGVKSPDATKLTIALGVLLALGAAGLSIQLAWRSRPRAAGAAQLAYARFCSKLARVHLVRAPQEGPQDFARRASAAQPELKTSIDRITALYLDARYLPEPTANGLATLRRLVHAFHT
jgi:transglutaminase-like putative cysteine protease